MTYEAFYLVRKYEGNADTMPRYFEENNPRRSACDVTVVREKEGERVRESLWAKKKKKNNCAKGRKKKGEWNELAEVRR